MLVNCKPGCAGKKTTTTGLLDVDTDEVICEFCGEELAVSSFVKRSMKYQGDILKKDKRKSFQFDCLTCNKNVQTEIKDDQLMGKECELGTCKFNVSKFTIHGMKSLSQYYRLGDNPADIILEKNKNGESKSDE